jgi:hypothetical protein
MENYLKSTVAMLSHITGIKDLTKMLKVSAYLNRQDVGLKILQEYMTA